MPRLEIQDITRNRNITQVQVTFINWFYSQFDNGSAANRRIVNVEPVYYTGIFGTAEFLVYSANKLYLAFEIGGMRYRIDNGAPTIAYINFYDENNVLFGSLFEGNGWWNSTLNAIRYGSNPALITNVYFSRIENLFNDEIKFIGYRITLI